MGTEPKKFPNIVFHLHPTGLLTLLLETMKWLSIEGEQKARCSFFRQLSDGREITCQERGCPGALAEHTLAFSKEETNPNGDVTTGIWAKGGASL